MDLHFLIKIFTGTGLLDNVGTRINFNVGIRLNIMQEHASEACSYIIYTLKASETIASCSCLCTDEYPVAGLALLRLVISLKPRAQS